MCHLVPPPMSPNHQNKIKIFLFLNSLSDKDDTINPVVQVLLVSSLPKFLPSSIFFFLIHFPLSVIVRFLLPQPCFMPCHRLPGLCPGFLTCFSVLLRLSSSPFDGCRHVFPPRPSPAPIAYALPTVSSPDC